MTDRTGRSLPLDWGGAARGVVSGAAILLLAGCITDWPGTDPAATEAAPIAAATPVSPPAAVPVPPVPGEDAAALQPQPSLFHAKAWALWDGGRTTGGIWVVLPQADMARRVRITNEDTGAWTDGALLRGTPGAGGTELEISSEAASALGLKPGSPAPVVIVALAYPEPAGPAGDGAAPPEPAEPDAPAAESGGGAATSAPATGAGSVSEPAWAPAPTEPLQSGPAPAEPVEAPPPELPTTPETSATPPAAVAEATAAGPATVPAEAPIADGKPFIQAGLFADARNAGQLIERLEAAGLTAAGLPLVRGTATLTRVVAGPFGSIAERDRALATVRRIGPADAMPVRG